MLEIRNIDVFYGDVQVIRDVSFAVNKGEVVALIGANGAGKSTILKTISGILRPNKGEIHFNGNPIHKTEAYQLIESGLVHVPEARRLFVEMTVEENLDMGSLKGEARKQREQSRQMVFELFPRLKERRRQLCGTLSGGEQQMVAVGRGLMAKPLLMMFDEPSLGLAPILVNEVFTKVVELRSANIAILLVEQNARKALQIADRGYVMEIGRIVLTGTGEGLRADAKVQEAYLGGKRAGRQHLSGGKR